MTLVWKHNSISLRLVRYISVHEDNVPSVKYIRNNHVCLFAFFSWLLFFQDFFWLQKRHSDNQYLFHWYAQDDHSLQKLHLVSLGWTLVHVQCHQVPHHFHCQARFFVFCLRIHYNTVESMQLSNLPSF